MISIYSRHLLVPVLAGLLIVGCTASTWEQEHPDFEYLPPGEQVDAVVDISTPNTRPFADFFDPDSLVAISQIGRFGSTADESYYFYTRPKKVEIDPQGFIYISQTYTNSIKVYDSLGVYQYSIGGGGNGPGEFKGLLTFSFDENYEHIYALDYFEVEIFSRKNGKFEYLGTKFHEFHIPYDMCILDNHLFISGFRFIESDKRKTDKVDYTAKITPPISKFYLQPFEYKYSFGFSYPSRSGYGTYEGILSNMMLSCNEASQTVIGYQKMLPYIFGYDLEGNQKWVSRINGYEFPRHTEFKKRQFRNPGLIQYTNAKPYFRRFPIQPVYHKGYELLQLVSFNPHSTRAAPGVRRLEERIFRSILIDASTGEMRYSDAYGHIGAKRGDMVITAERDPESNQHIFKVNKIVRDEK